MKSNDTNYPSYIVITAYFTAFITIGIHMLVYYFTQDRLPIQNKLIKSFVLCAILLELKGDLIRYTLVGYLDLRRIGAPCPFTYIILTQLDKWIPNLIISCLLVYGCPKRSLSK
jgi:hypothetical protein